MNPTMPDHWHKVWKGEVDINLRYCNIGEDEAKEVARALMDPTTNVQSLNLFGTQIGTNGVTSIAKALKVNSTLQSLDLGHNEIGDVAVAAIAEALTTKSTLQVLWKKLSENSIGVYGAKFVAKAWKEALDVRSKLETLNLSGNAIGEDGATAIAEALKFNSTLQTLDLSRNETIGSSGAIALAPSPFGWMIDARVQYRIHQVLAHHSIRSHGFHHGISL